MALYVHNEEITLIEGVHATCMYNQIVNTISNSISWSRPRQLVRISILRSAGLIKNSGKAKVT